MCRSGYYASGFGKHVILQKIIIGKSTCPDLVYYGIPAPWIQIKLFQILQIYAPICNLFLLIFSYQ
jgi:hypothetical protein